MQALFAGRGIDIDQMVARLKHTAENLGLPFTTRTMTYNSRRAQELGKWAEARGRGERFHRLAFEAYFAQGRNLADITVLRALAVDCGMDPAEAEQVLAQGRYAADVDRDWQRAYQLGITAVPTFLANGRSLVGAQPYEAIAHLIVSAGGAAKSH